MDRNLFTLFSVSISALLLFPCVVQGLQANPFKAGPYATTGAETINSGSLKIQEDFDFSGNLQRNYDSSNSFKSYGKSWAQNVPQGLVFIYGNDFNETEIATILEAATEIRNSSCIPVVVKHLKDFVTNSGALVDSPYFRNYVYMQKTTTKPCWSNIGMQGGEQVMHVNTHPYFGCTSKPGYLVHEMMHALGYDHEHCRPDRDTFVSVNFSNIRYGNEKNFQINNDAPTVGNYDINSILHYSAYSRAADPTYPTISSKIPNFSVPEEQSTLLTDTDRYKIQVATGCKLN